MKVLFTGDWHLSDRQIGSRMDDSAATCLAKLEWILNYALKIGAVVVSTGDIFTHSLYGNMFRYNVKRLLRDFYSGNYFPAQTIHGNHRGDCLHGDPNALLYSELGQFILDGYLGYLGSFNGDAIHDLSVSDSRRIRGYSAYTEPCLDDAEKVVGLVCHHWIQDAFDDSLVVYPDDMKKLYPNLEFIVAGHDHSAHPPFVSRDGVLVVRPGSVMRTGSGKGSDRIPQVVVWGSGENSWEYVPIAVARPYSEVFHVEAKVSETSAVDAISAFVERMQKDVATVMDVDSVIKAMFAQVPAADKDFVKRDLAASGFLV